MKIKLYALLKAFGLFNVCKFLFRNKVIILAYHGFEMEDECDFVRGPLFTKQSTLEKRLLYLKKNNFNVLGLSSALNTLKEGEKISHNSVVITVDDGWYSILSVADEIFSKFSMPYTIYISSYYSKKGLPVLNIALRYILWACRKKELEMNQLNIQKLSGVYQFETPDQKELVKKKLFEYFNTLKSTEHKLDFVKKAAHLFEVDYLKIEEIKYLNLLDMGEIRMLSEKGVDIQLHTHRHRMSSEQNVVVQKDVLEKEIADNKACLHNCRVQNKLEHFCYPSGAYNQECESILKNLGITSATTCDSGFVNRKSNHYFLPRFLDGEHVSQIEFEAEVCGISELLRKIRNLFNYIRNIDFKTKGAAV